MKIEKHSIQACCGKTSTIYKIDRPLTKDHLKAFVELGFNEATHFTQAGILYADNSELILQGPFGSDRLQIKCKIQDCTEKLNDFERLLEQME